MSIPTPDFLLCPICRTRFNGTTKKPISLLCGHTCCSNCLQLMHRKQCPLDATPFQQEDIDSFPTNQALLLLVTENKTEENSTKALQNGDDSKNDEKVVGHCIGELALYLKPLSSGSQKNGNSITLSRPMQRKLVALVHCQLAEPVGRARALRAARSLGERTCTELILQHQNQQQLSSMLWAAVRTRGCQFLGPAMQEAALKYILLSLEQGEALSRKVLVLYVVQQLEPHFPQASKTSIGHVVQLLYRASCFKVAKRNDDSSLMQLKEEYRTYEALRREHDAQIVNMAQEAGIRIPPDQWSQLLYGDTAHKSHMQSIIDRLQTPASFTQSIQELMIALSRTEDNHSLSALAIDFNTLAAINPATEDNSVTWSQLKEALISLRNVVKGLERFLQAKAKVKGLVEHTGGCLHESCNAHGKYKTTMCRDLLLPQSCPRGASCTFAHTQEEMEKYRNQKKNLKHLSDTEHSATCMAVNGSQSTGSLASSTCSEDISKVVYRPLSNSPSVSQPVVSQQIKVSQPLANVPHSNGGMLPPPPFPPHSLSNLGAPNTPNQLPTSRWNGGGVLPPNADPRLATPRLPPYPNFPAGAGTGARQLDAETLQLLQLKQQLLQQQGVQTPLPPSVTQLPLHNLTTEQLLTHHLNSRANTLSGEHNVPSVTNIDLQNRINRQQQQPPSTKSDMPLWEQPGKIGGLGGGNGGTLPPPTPNLWGSTQYDPLVTQLSDEALLRQELLKHYNQISLASSPGISSSLLNQLQAQQHLGTQLNAAQQLGQLGGSHLATGQLAASPSPALASYSNTNNLASRLYQLRLSQQLENSNAGAFGASPSDNLANSYDRLLPPASTPTVQQLKYELAKAEGAKYEQLLNNSALLSHLQTNNGLTNGGGLSNGLSGGIHNGLSHGMSGDLTNGLSNGITSDFAKSASALNSGPVDPYSSAPTPNIWQSDTSWHSFLSSRPTSVAVGGSGFPTSGEGSMDASLHQLIQHYDRNLAFQLHLDDIE